jgi:hypothetical protein
MKSHDAIQTRTLSLIGTPALRLGPHNDLRDFCDLSGTEADSDVAVFLEQAFTSNNRKVRIAAARKAIDATYGKCGIAWAVLAREGASSIDEAITYSDQALAHMRHELKADMSGAQRQAFLIDNNTYALALSDAAQLRWNCGRREAAINMLLARIEKDTDFIDQHYSIVIALTVSLLIRNHQSEDARRLLLLRNDDAAEWHYLNALVHFATTGDTAYAGAALAQALSKGDAIATRLIRGNRDASNRYASNRDASKRDASELELDLELVEMNCAQYIDTVEPAWHSVNGALDWLKKETARCS